MRKIINSEPHVVKHKCNIERDGKIMTSEELHELAVNTLREEYSMSGNHVGQYAGSDGRIADLCLDDDGNHINILVVYSDTLDIDLSKIDTSWMIEEYRRYGAIPRLTIASGWCFDSDGGKPAICGGSFCFKYYNISLLPDEVNSPLPKVLTPIQLAAKYAEAWKKYSADIIAPYLDKDFHYHSDWVFDEMPSRYEYVRYFQKKLDTLRKSNSMGDIKPAMNKEDGQVGVILYQNGINPCILLLETENGRIMSASMKGYTPKENEEILTSEEVEKEESDIDQVHGDHIDAIMPTDKFLKEYISGVIQEGKLYRKTVTEVSMEGMQNEKTDVFAIRHGFDQMSMLSLIATNRRENANQFVSTYPMLEGRNYDVVIDKVHVWDNQIEATVDCHIDDFDFSFFAVDYYVNKRHYVPGAGLSVNLAALGMHVEAADRGFEFKGQQAIDFLAKTGEQPEYDENGEVRPLHFSLENLVAYLRTREKAPDEGEFQSPVHRIMDVHRDFLDVPFTRAVVSICNHNEKEEVYVPLYFRKDMLPVVYEGDPIRGWLWLTGALTGKHSPSEETALGITNTFGRKASEYANYLKEIDLDDRDDVNFILRQLPSLGMDDGYMMDLFRNGDSHGSVYQLYALRTTAQDTWRPEPYEIMEEKRRDGFMWGMFDKKKRKKNQIEPYRDDLYVDGLMPYEYSKMVPSVFTHLSVPFTEAGIMDAWLLHMSHFFLPRAWHAGYGVSDYIFSTSHIDSIIEHLKTEDREGSTDALDTLMSLDPKTLLPSVEINRDTAIVKFTYWNDWSGLVAATEEVHRNGHSVTFSDGGRINLAKYDCGIRF